MVLGTFMLPLAWKVTFWFAVHLAGSTALDFGEVELLWNWDLGFGGSIADGTEVVRNVGRSQAGMGGEGASAALKSTTKIKHRGGCLLLHGINEGDGFCDLSQGAYALSRSCRTGPYMKGVFPALYMHQGIVNANNLQPSEQTKLQTCFFFSYLLSNDYAELFIKCRLNQSSSLYALNR